MTDATTKSTTAFDKAAEAMADVTLEFEQRIQIADRWIRIGEALNASEIAKVHAHA